VTIALFALAFLSGIAYVFWLATTVQDDEPAATPSAGRLAAAVDPTSTFRPTAVPSPFATVETVPSPEPLFRSPKIGIVAGHWRSDSGAVCPDGLQEVKVNLDIASRVVAILQDKGYRVELLPEFSEKLDGYRADVFVSIHADSCEAKGASGFKVARVVSSAIPEEEDRLVRCLVKEYGQGTGLRLHKNSITFDMTAYHAFWEIDPGTPGAIIELGFLGADRELLTKRSSAVAQAVASGILCFLEDE
jgi:N-acetylmuramoyl-L-alanine amidase